MGQDGGIIFSFSLKRFIISIDKFVSFLLRGDTTLKGLIGLWGQSLFCLMENKLWWVFAAVPSPITRLIQTLGAKGLLCSSCSTHACWMIVQVDCAPELTAAKGEIGFRHNLVASYGRRGPDLDMSPPAMNTLQSCGCLEHLLELIT